MNFKLIALCRLLAGFAIAPVSVPFIAIAFSSLLGTTMFTEFFLGVGARVGYGSALVVGIPFYFLVLKGNEKVTFRAVMAFVPICAFVLVAPWGAVIVQQDGVLALLSPTFIGYSLLAVIAVLISTLVFYAVAYLKLR